MSQSHWYPLLASLALLALPVGHAAAQQPDRVAQPRAIGPAGGGDEPRRPARRGVVSDRVEQPHRIEIDGVVLPSDARVVSRVGVALEVSRLTSPSDQVTRIVPGRPQDIRVVISGALPLPNQAVAWFDQVRAGTVARRSAAIILLDTDRQTELQRIQLRDVLPVALDADLPSARWHLTLAVEAVRFEVQ